MRLRRLAIQAAKGSPIWRPSASTPAVARLKPRRQDPRDAQRTFPRLSGLNPRTSACGRALGTSGSLWRAACPFQRAAPQWYGDSAQASPARMSVLRRFAPLAALKPAHRCIFGESVQASVRDSPRCEVALQGRRQRRRRCRAKHQPARRRSGASARFAPPRRRAAGPSPAAQALPGQAPARSAPQRRLRSIRPAATSRRRAVASGAGAAWPSISPLGAASPACANAPPASPASASAAAAAHAARAKPRLRAAGRPKPVLPRRAVRAALRRRRHPPLACGLLRLGAAPPRSIGFASAGPRSFRAGMRGALRRAGSAGAALARRERPGPSAALWPSWAATGRKPALRAGGRARGRRGGPAWSGILKTGGGWGGCAPSSSRRHRRGEAACGTPPLGRWAEDVDGRLPRPRACALIRAGGGYGSHFWPVHEKVIELTCCSAQLRPELAKSGS